MSERRIVRVATDLRTPFHPIGYGLWQGEDGERGQRRGPSGSITGAAHVQRWVRRAD